MIYINIKNYNDLKEQLEKIPIDLEELAIGCDRPSDTQKFQRKEEQVVIEEIKLIHKFSRLKKLSLSYLDLKAEALTNIAEIKSLKELSLDRCRFKKLNWASELNTLDTLSLDYCSIMDIANLKELHALTVLRLFTNTITNIESLGGLTNLVELDLGYNKIKDLSPLSHLSKLQKLRCNGYNWLESLKPLEDLKDLKTLTVDILKKEKARFAKVRPDIEIQGHFFS